VIPLAEERQKTGLSERCHALDKHQQQGAGASVCGWLMLPADALCVPHVALESYAMGSAWSLYSFCGELWDAPSKRQRYGWRVINWVRPFRDVAIELWWSSLHHVQIWSRGMGGFGKWAVGEKSKRVAAVTGATAAAACARSERRTRRRHWRRPPPWRSAAARPRLVRAIGGAADENEVDGVRWAVSRGGRGGGGWSVPPVRVLEMALLVGRETVPRCDAAATRPKLAAATAATPPGRWPQ